MREVGIVLIVSFAIERIVNGIFFLLSFRADLRTLLDPDCIQDPVQKANAKKVYRLVYAIFAGYLGTVIFAGQLGVRLSKIAELTTDREIPGWLDVFLTGLLLAGGADRLAEGLKALSEGGKDKSKTPIEITGKVVLEEGAQRRQPLEERASRAGHL